MPPPFAVILQPHDPHWATLAADEGARLAAAIDGACVVHHIGSTAIPRIAAKPVIDLMPVAATLEAIDAARGRIAALGYRWHGEYGLAGRRYCTRDDTAGRRLFQVHCYATGDAAVTRHLAFRDHLRARREVALAYEAEKRRCAALYSHDSHAYADCKSDWVRRVEAEALAALG